MKHYLLISSGGVEMSTKGPYKTDESRDKAAKRLWNKELDQMEDNVFAMDINDKGSPGIWSYSNAFMEDE